MNRSWLWLAVLFVLLGAVLAAVGLEAGGPMPGPLMEPRAY